MDTQMAGRQLGVLGGRGRANMATTLTVVVLVVVVLLGWYMMAPSLKVGGAYQAVFLSNNQVYFGKAVCMGRDYVKLTDVYYLLLQKPLQNQQKDEAGNPVTPQPQFTLRKLGNEIHGPMDEMVINRDNILFIEGLKDDSKVVKAIADYKKQPQEVGVEEPAPAPEPESTPVPAPNNKTTK